MYPHRNNFVVLAAVAALAVSSLTSCSRSNGIVVLSFTINPTTSVVSRNSRRRIQQQQQHQLFMSSAPSDSASLSDDENDFSEQGYGSSITMDGDYDDEESMASATTTTTPNTIDGIVSKIFDLLPNNSFVVSSNDSTKDEELRAKINEMIVKLERLSSTSGNKLTTQSPVLNGVWELRYVGGYTPTKIPFFSISPTRQLALFLYSGGYSPGVFAYTLAQQLPKAIIDTSEKCVTITISRTQPRIEASCAVKLLNGLVDGTIKVMSSLEIVSDVRFRETYESTTILGSDSSSSALLSPISLPKPLQYSRDLYITYLDDDILIVRDGTGVPEILLRQSKTFMKDWGFEPSMMDDMVPPGDGIDANF